MLDEIGGFDEDFFAYGDDAELGLRARIAGWKCLYTPDAVVRHHRGATLGLGSARRLELIERNRVLLAAQAVSVEPAVAEPGRTTLARARGGACGVPRGHAATSRVFPALRRQAARGRAR